MDDQIDSDVENGSAPPTLPNLLTLADQQGDDDEETIGGLSDGDYDDGDDGDNIGTLSEEKNPGIRTETPHEEKNPSHPTGNKFFYISLKVMLLYHSMDTTSQPYRISPKA